MADVYSAIILDNNYWDGTTSWAGEASEAARDSKYSTRRYTSLSAWNTARDGAASGGDTEYGNIFGPWASHDTAEFLMSGWTANVDVVIQTTGTNARSQDGKFGSNSCYVLESDSAAAGLQLGTGVIPDNLTIEGLQFLANHVGSTYLFYGNRIDQPVGVVSKCYFRLTDGDYAIWVKLGTSWKIVNCIIDGATVKYGIRTGVNTKIYNCTLSAANRANPNIYDAGGTVVVKNCAVFNNADDFNGPDTIDYCASDDQDGTNSQNLGGNAAGWNAAFTDYSNGDFTIKDTNSVLYQTGQSQTNDGDVPSDDIIGTARVDGSESIGAYEYVAAGGNVNVSATTDALILTEYSATVNAETNVEAGVDALVITENVADVNLDVSVSAGVDALVLTEHTSDVNLNVSVSAGIDALILTEYGVTVNAEMMIAAGVDALILSEYAANVDDGLAVTIRPRSGLLLGVYP